MTTPTSPTPPLAFIGNSPVIREVRRKLRLAGRTGREVLLTGETGTGKGLATRIVHQWSRRSSRPLVFLHGCSRPPFLRDLQHLLQEQQEGIPPRPRRSLLEMTRGGVIVLDEVGETTPEEQVQVLALFNRRPGEAGNQASKPPLDVQILATSQIDLGQAVAEQRFRADLFHCLQGYPIHLPPLRDRREDIPLLAEHFLAQIADRHQRAPCRLTPIALELLLCNYWPGNVRELQHCLERATLLATPGSIEPQHIRP